MIGIGIRTLTLIGLAATAAVTVPASADKPGDTDTTKTSYSESQKFDCGNGNTVGLAGPDTLWPPNHKMVAEKAIAHSGSTSGNGTTITITPQVTDVAGGDGPENGLDYSGDLMGSGTGAEDAVANFQVRAERSGKGLGRTYTVNWSATFNDGDSCSSSSSTTDELEPFVIEVPHDQGQGQATGRS